MDRMDDLEAFIAIVEKGSQTAAAKHLRRSLQSIGRSLGTLERSVGVELVRRSTRRSQPTAAGLTLYRRLKPALLEINDAKSEVGKARAEPFGVLTIASPVRFASAFVVPVICDFMRRYPQIDVELKTSDRKADVYEDGLDLAIRIRDLPDSGLRARRLGQLRVVVFGAPAYFEKHGRPRHPVELARHQCILRSADPEGEQWPFRVRGKRETFRVSGRFSTDDAAAVSAAVADGLGLGLAPAWHIRSLVEEGTVQVVLEEFEAATIPIFAVSPPTKTPAARTRLFIDMLVARMKRERL
jgi:DNA-binding transcriptional LysR family regulator